LSRFLGRLARIAAILLLAVFLLLTLLGGGLWWWSGTEGSLAWSLERLGRWQPVVAEGVSGSLRSGLRIKRLSWEQDGLKVQAQGVAVEWSPQFLLAGELRLQQFSAASVEITDRRPPSPSAGPPQSLDPGLRMALDKVEIGRLRYDGAATFEASGLAGDYVFSGRRHLVRIGALKVGNGNYRGRATVGATGDLNLDAAIEGTVSTSVPGGTTSLPLAFVASLKGPLQQLDARARVALAGAPASGPPPGATVTAVITPWAGQPLPQARAVLQAIDLHAFWADAPQTQLSGEVRVQPAGTATWALQLDLRNALPGPWDSGRLPVDSAKAEGQWRDGIALVRRLDASLGGGSLQAQGRWSEQGWSADGTLRGVDPAALHTKLAASALGGKLDLRQDGKAIAFDAALLASGPSRPAARKKGGVAPLDLRELTARGTWADGVLAVPALRVRTSDSLLRGALTARPAAKSGSGNLELQAPGLQAKADGEIAPARGSGNLHLQAADLALAQRWLLAWPFTPAALGTSRIGGQAALDGSWQGGWQDPTVRATLTAALLTVQPASTDAAAVPAWTVRNARVAIDGRLADAAVELQARAEQGQRRFNLDAAGRGGLAGSVGRVNLARLQFVAQDPMLGPGAWRADLKSGGEARWQGGKLEIGAGQAVLTAPGPTAGTALLAWDSVRWGGGELQTAGRLTGLPMAWVELFGGPQMAGSALTGNMVFDARWDAQLGAGMRIDASLARSSGDVTVQVENAEGAMTRVAAGVRTAALTLQGRDGAIALELEWDSERAGTARAALQSRLVRGGPAGWDWPADAQITGSAKAQLPRLAVWSLLAPPGWRLRGSLAADVAVSGSRSDPQFSGKLDADELALRSVVDGVELRNGWLKARLQGQKLVVDEFVLHGGGQGEAGGSIVAKGEGHWEDGAPQLQATAELNKLRASIRSDRELTVSGKLGATLTPKGGAIRGNLTVDQARIVIPEQTPPKLGSDVIVRDAPGVGATAEQRKQKKPEAGPPKRPLDVSVQVDLGRQFRLTGRGINTRLAGELALSGVSLTAPRLEGTVRAVDGEYRAYGQQLDIERGVIRFTGAIDNPSLDILAVRPRMEQRVGVLITGSAQAPFVRLYSEPQLTEAETLAWLVTGKASASGGAEAALVQQAALALLASRRGGADSGGIAGRFGLDELSVRRDDTEGAIVTVGKRFARDFYASYESSLGGALGTLNVFYDVSRRLTLRARAGERTALDLIYTFTFD